MGFHAIVFKVFKEVEFFLVKVLIYNVQGTGFNGPLGKKRGD